MVFTPPCCAGARPSIPLSFLSATFFLGAAGLFPVYLAELAVTGPFALSRDIVLSILYVALFPSIVAYFCWNKGVDLVGPNRAGLFINLIPAFASLLSVWLLGESIQPFHIGGMGLILGGMVLFYSARGRHRILDDFSVLVFRFHPRRSVLHCHTEKAVLYTLYFRKSLPAVDELDLDAIDRSRLQEMAEKYSFHSEKTSPPLQLIDTDDPICDTPPLPRCVVTHDSVSFSITNPPLPTA